MKQIFLMLCMIMSLATYAQTEYDISKDDVTGSKVYKGKCTPEDLNKESTFSWYRKGVKSYKPDRTKIVLLHQYLKNYNVTVFMGTWCDDSHNLVPKLVKVLKEAEYPTAQFTIYGVDREKLTKGNAQAQYNISLVPTIIVFKDTKEIGRITEVVKTSIESDLADIVQKDIAFGK